MSTLFNQPEREHKRAMPSNIDDFLTFARDLAQKHKVDVATVVAVKQALELQRRNDLQVANGDVFDEQMAGFGEILGKIASILKDGDDKLQ
jgi:hypothetical protein